MREDFEGLLTPLLVCVLTVCFGFSGCNDRDKDPQPQPDPYTERNRTFQQTQKEMKARNEELNRADKLAKHNHTYGHDTSVVISESSSTPPVVNTGPIAASDVGSAVQPSATVPTLGDSITPAVTSTGLAKVQPGATFFMVITSANNYPGCPLEGCNNDGDDMYAIGQSYAAEMGITKVDAVRLTDTANSTANHWKALQHVVDTIKPGDYFLYWNSGHGAEYAGKDTSQEPDGMNQIICPQDFDWSEEHMITDKQFNQLFSKLPKGVIANWGSDSCHSGDLTKVFPSKRVMHSKNYPLPPPPAVAMQLAKVRLSGKRVRSMPMLNIAYISGCKYDQFSADLQDDNGRPCGALTWAFRTELMKNRLAPLTSITANVNTFLDSMQLNQNPQDEGPAVEVKRAFLQPIR